MVEKRSRAQPPPERAVKLLRDEGENCDKNYSGYLKKLQEAVQTTQESKVLMQDIQQTTKFK